MGNSKNNVESLLYTNRRQNLHKTRRQQLCFIEETHKKLTSHKGPQSRKFGNMCTLCP